MFVCECFCCLIRLCVLFVMCCVLSDMIVCVLSVRVLFDVYCVLRATPDAMLYGLFFVRL